VRIRPRVSPARTVHIETELPTDVERVWDALRHPASFSYVTRGVVGFSALAGRTDVLWEGESGTGWLLLFHVIPLSRHTITIVEVDHATRTLRTEEHGGLLRTWNHSLHVEPLRERTCIYSDTVDIEAGVLTGVVAWAAVLIYRYRQRRWHKLVHRYLMPAGPVYARSPHAPSRPVLCPTPIRTRRRAPSPHHR
jgi:hypothetical protein